MNQTQTRAARRSASKLRRSGADVQTLPWSAALGQHGPEEDYRGPSRQMRELVTAQTVAYVDANGETTLLVERATGRVLYAAPKS